MRRTIQNENVQSIDGTNFTIGIIASRFHDDITEKLLEGAMDILLHHKVQKENIEVAWVPGSFEIPFGCQQLARTKKYDALIALGCVIKGGTDHHMLVGGEASRGVMQVSLEHHTPIGFGVITANTLEQAQERSGEKENRGTDAALAALTMIVQ